MTALPSIYSDLSRETGPKMLLELLKLYGTVEGPGAADNPQIISWANEVALGAVYKHDATAWCGLTMAVAAQRAGKPVPKDPLWALNWRSFGSRIARPMLGDIMTKTRQGGGHVTMYVGEDATHYHCLGGNQSDSVSIARIAKTESWVYNRPPYHVQPASVRIIRREANGHSGGSEA